MTTKEWLQRGWQINKRIALLKKEKEKLFELAIGTVGALKEDKVQKSVGNSSEAKFIKYADYSKLIDDMIAELYNVKNEVLKAIRKVKNPRLQTLLQLRYIQFMTWEEISEDMELSEKWVRTVLHSQALSEIEKVRGQH